MIEYIGNSFLNNQIHINMQSGKEKFTPRPVPGKLAMNLHPKHIMAPVDLLNFGEVKHFAKDNSIGLIHGTITAILGMIRTHYDNHLRVSGDDKPFKAHMQAWFATAGGNIIHALLPAMNTRNGKFDIELKLDLLEEFRKSNPFYASDDPLTATMREGLNRTKTSLMREDLLRIEEKMIDELKTAKNHLAKNQSDMYQRFMGILEDRRGEHRFDNFFLALAKRIAKKPEEADMMYLYDNEELSRLVLNRILRTLREQGAGETADTIMGMKGNNSLLKHEEEEQVSPKALLRRVA